ncbi:hypothetical protein ScPMuIL_012804 [Solemya velum]
MAKWVSWVALLSVNIHLCDTYFITASVEIKPTCDAQGFSTYCWSLDALTASCQETYIEASSYTSELHTLCEESGVFGKNSEDDLSEKLNQSTSNLHQSSAPLDVIYVGQILEVIAAKEDIDLQTAKNVMSVADNLLKAAPSSTIEARRLGHSTNRVLQSLETILEKVGLQYENLVKIVRDETAAVLWSTSYQRDNSLIGLELYSDNLEPLAADSLVILEDYDQLVFLGLEVAVLLPRELIEGKSIRIIFQVFNSELFFNASEQLYKVNSKIIAVSLLLNGERITDLGGYHVTTVFRPFQNDTTPICAYWDYTAQNSAGGWAVDGAMFDGFQNGRVICKYSHLTNFAILLDFHGKGEYNAVLHIITTVGLCLSIAGLTITVLFFLAFREMRASRGQKVLFYLALSMLCSMIVFIVGINRTEHRIGCIIVAVLLHYFILVTFMWMLMEAILQYLRLVKVLGTYIPNFIGKAAVTAWGIPLIPVGIVCAFDYNLYFGGLGYCWMSLMPLYYAFAVPVGIIIFVNLVIFAMIIVSMCQRKVLRSNEKKRKRFLRNLQAAMTIFILLGLTWISGYLAIEDTAFVFNVIFCFTGAFQGFFLFVLFAVREKRVRDFFRSIMCCTNSDSTKNRRRLESTETYQDFPSDPSPYNEMSRRMSVF